MPRRRGRLDEDGIPLAWTDPNYFQSSFNPPKGLNQKGPKAEIKPSKLRLTRTTREASSSPAPAKSGKNLLAESKAHAMNWDATEQGFERQMNLMETMRRFPAEATERRRVWHTPNR